MHEMQTYQNIIRHPHTVVVPNPQAFFVVAGRLVAYAYRLCLFLVGERSERAERVFRSLRSPTKNRTAYKHTLDV